MARVSTLAFLLVSIVASVRADVKQLKSTKIKVKTDHSKTPTVQDEYDHRYLYNIDDYDSAKGPVLFYAGGEGDIEAISNKQKLFRTLAQNLTAAIVFAEHRYYGESLPFGDKPTLDNLKYLTVENVLADYVAVINHFRANVGKNANAPVIVYGSKYAGLLAAWLKVQNDQLITGAIASSAPVLDFNTNTDAQGRPALGDYDKRVTKIYTDAGCNIDALKQAFGQIARASAANLNTLFRLSPAIGVKADALDAAIPKIRYLARQALYAIAENNYPYAAKTGWNGVETPAYPAQEACKSLKTASANDNGIEDLKNLATAVNVYYGTSGNIIFQTDAEGYVPGTIMPDIAEAYEHCTGTALYRCPMGGDNDFLPTSVYCGDANNFPDVPETQCTKWLSGSKLKINTTWIQSNLGFDYASKKNIVFVTGSLDPNAAGVYAPKDANADAKNSLYTYQAEQGTTGHDLLEPNTCDPNTVKNARYQIVKIVKCWSGLLAGTDCDNLQKDLPSYDASAKPSSCATEAYPWGQTDAPPPTATTPTGGHTGGGASAASFSALAILGSFLMAAMLR